MRNCYKNFAFISYSHKDLSLAKWLQKRLERYKLPTEIHNEIDVRSRYIRPVFRDQSDLNSGVLSDELRKNLEDSKFLILICSRNSAQSAWVSQEAKAFVEMGRLERIIPVIVSDEGTDERELFPIYLREYFAQNPGKELLGINISEAGKEKALIRVVSRMLGLSFDSLWKRHQRRKRIKIASLSACALFSIIVLYLFAIPVRMDVRIQIQKANLPIGETILMNIDGAEYSTATTNPFFETISLPGYKRFSKIGITVSSKHFVPVDTLISVGFGIRRRLYIHLIRDPTFGKFKGYVVNPELNPVEGVRVDVAGLADTTDSNGEFDIFVPLEMQKPVQLVKLSKDNRVKSDSTSPDESICFLFP